MSNAIHQDGYEIGTADGGLIDLACLGCATAFVAEHTEKQLVTGEPFQEDGVFASWHWPDGHCEDHKCVCGALLEC
jgi:hypothetical protein